MLNEKRIKRVKGWNKLNKITTVYILTKQSTLRLKNSQQRKKKLVYPNIREQF